MEEQEKENMNSESEKSTADTTTENKSSDAVVETHPKKRGKLKKILLHCALIFVGLILIFLDRCKQMAHY